MRRIVVVPSDPEWPRRFEIERTRLLGAVPAVGLVVHHIGSTSVPGLAAKPIIDILLEVPRIADLDDAACTAAFTGLGYVVRGEYGIPGRRYFQLGGDDRTHHVHAFETGSWGARRHLAVRDFLRAHPDAVRDYAAVKRRAAAAHPNDIGGYCDAKDAFVADLEARAVAWSEGGTSR